MARRCVSEGGRGRGGSDELVDRAGGGGGSRGGFCRNLAKIEILSASRLVIPLGTFGIDDYYTLYGRRKGHRNIFHG